MKKISNYMKTRKPTLASIKRSVKKGNPGIKGLTIVWEAKPKWLECLGDRGSYYWSARVKIGADNYRGKTMVVSVDEDSIMIR